MTMTSHAHEGWEKAVDIKKFYEAHKGEKYEDYSKKLHFIQREWAAYGDWDLYVDDDGNYYEEYTSIGD